MEIPNSAASGATADRADTVYHASPGHLAHNRDALDVTREAANSAGSQAGGLVPAPEGALFPLYPTPEHALKAMLETVPDARTAHILTCRFRPSAMVCEAANGNCRRSPDTIRPLIEELGAPKGWGYWWWVTLSQALDTGALIDDRSVFNYAALAGGIASGGGMFFDNTKLDRLAQLLRLAGYDAVTLPDGRGAALNAVCLEVESAETRPVRHD